MTTENKQAEAAVEEKKQPVTILDRLKAVEELSNGLAGYLENTLEPKLDQVDQIKTAVANMVEVVNGLIVASGEGFELKVQQAIKDTRAKRMADQVEREKKMVAQLVSSNVIVPTDVVTTESFIVGREFSPDGNLLGSGRAQVQFNQFSEDARAKVLGQGVGFMIEAPTGKFEVTEIYNPATPKPPEVAAPLPVEDLPGAPKDPQTPPAE